MAGQQSGGNKKRPRKPRTTAAILKQEKREMRRFTKQERYENMINDCSMNDPIVVPKYQAPCRRTGTLDLPKDLKRFRFTFTNKLPVSEQKHHTFEDLYRQSKKTRGRLGLNPDPDRRKDENYMQLHHPVGTFRIGDLVSRVTIDKSVHNKAIKWFARY